MTYIRPRILEDGTVIYPRRGWEPPPPIPGYTRKSRNPKSGDAWIFLPDWNFCEHRKEFTVQREGCRCETLIYRCQHTTQKDLLLNTAICEACKLNEPDL